MADNKTKTDIKLLDKDQSSPITGGDFRLREVSLHSRSNNSIIHLNVGGVFVSLDIYEDLFSETLRGTFTFADNQGLLETVPIIGDEDLVISYGTPGSEGTGTDYQEKKDLKSEDKSEEAIRQKFKIYDCIETPLSDEGTTKIYKLFFISWEYVIDKKIKISKGYKSRFYHQIVEDSLKKINEEIYSDYQKNVFIEKTATPQNVIVPNWTPFQTIDFCSKRSTSAATEESNQDNPDQNQLPNAPGSLFVFYEKLGTGFFYESIETMIINQKSKGSIPLYQYAPKTTEGSDTNLPLQYYGVDKYEVKSSFKTLENLGNGMYGSKLIAYDPIRMKYDEVKYDYYERKEKPVKEFVEPKTGATISSADPSQEKDDSQRIFANFIATDIHPKERTQNKLISDVSDYLGSNDASIKLATTTRAHDAMFTAPMLYPPAFSITNTSIGVNAKTFKDNEAKPNQIETWLLQRKAQLQEFGNIIVTFTIEGNSSRHVGDLIRFELPTSMTPNPPVFMPEIGHQLYSGYYLISKIHHKITPSEYKTDLEIIKNSFAKRIPGQTTETSTDGTTT